MAAGPCSSMIDTLYLAHSGRASLARTCQRRRRRKLAAGHGGCAVNAQPLTRRHKGLLVILVAAGTAGEVHANRPQLGALRQFRRNVLNVPHRA